MGHNTRNSVYMTKEEFNKYLESIGGLERSWRPERGKILNSNFFEINEGWYDLVKCLIGELIVIGWDKQVNQVKEKFGGLRFYVENLPEGAYEIIDKYENLSYKTCETCGKEGVLRKGSWLKTLCDEHANGSEPFKFPK